MLAWSRKVQTPQSREFETSWEDAQFHWDHKAPRQERPTTNSIWGKHKTSIFSHVLLYTSHSDTCSLTVCTLPVYKRTSGWRWLDDLLCTGFFFNVWRGLRAWRLQPHLVTDRGTYTECNGWSFEQPSLAPQQPKRLQMSLGGNNPFTAGENWTPVNCKRYRCSWASAEAEVDVDVDVDVCLLLASSCIHIPVRTGDLQDFEKTMCVHWQWWGDTVQCAHAFSSSSITCNLQAINKSLHSPISISLFQTSFNSLFSHSFQKKENMYTGIECYRHKKGLIPICWAFLVSVSLWQKNNKIKISNRKKSPLGIYAITNKM